MVDPSGRRKECSRDKDILVHTPETVNQPSSLVLFGTYDQRLSQGYLAFISRDIADKRRGRAEWARLASGTIATHFSSQCCSREPSRVTLWSSNRQTAITRTGPKKQFGLHVVRLYGWKQFGALIITRAGHQPQQPGCTWCAFYWSYWHSSHRFHRRHCAGTESTPLWGKFQLWGQRAPPPLLYPCGRLGQRYQAQGHRRFC